METQYTVISSEKRARFATVFILISVCITVLMGLVGSLGVLIRQGTFFAVDQNVINVYIAVSGFVVLAFVMMILASAITFIMWFWKAYGNLQELGCWTLSARGWTIGCWFIPIANLYLPYMFMREMFDGVNDLLKDRNELNVKWASTRLVLSWWILSAMMVVLNQFTRQLDLYFLNNHGMYLLVLIVTIGFTVVSGILAVRMIRSYVEAEKELIALSQERDIAETDQLFI